MSSLRWPDRSWVWLLRKEWRELLVSRAWWVLAALTGPLVGVSFITAVRTYSEASAGAVYGGAEAFSPLDGIWSPTFGAFELAAIFLLPFVAIRLFSADRMSGALKLELQQPMPVGARLLAKTLVLGAGCAIAATPGLIAIVLWQAYGGSVYVPEVFSVVLGHALNAAITIAVAAAAAAIADHPATAAITALGFTVGGWAIEFVAAVHGGRWEGIAAYTPSAMVATFQRGLVRADVMLAALALVSAGLALAGIWLPPGRPARGKLAASVATLAVALTAIGAASFARSSWDLSENRRNSFAVADERALEALPATLLVEAHLAQRDPRRFDLEHQVVQKLRRTVPALEVRYVARTSIGLFEQTDAGYGEIHYEMNGRRATTRMTTADAALDAIYSIAHVDRGDEDDDPFEGHPLTTEPVGAGVVFYALWPLNVLAAGVWLLHRPG